MSKRRTEGQFRVVDWTSSVRSGGPTGPSAWDGYMSLLGAVYGIKPLESGGPQRSRAL